MMSLSDLSRGISSSIRHGDRITKHDSSTEISIVHRHLVTSDKTRLLSHATCPAKAFLGCCLASVAEACHLKPETSGAFSSFPEQTVLRPA